MRGFLIPSVAEPCGWALPSVWSPASGNGQWKGLIKVKDALTSLLSWRGSSVECCWRATVGSLGDVDGANRIPCS